MAVRHCGFCMVRLSLFLQVTDADPRKSSMLRCCQGGKPGWNLNTALPDEAIEYIITRTATNPKRPWFIHYAQGATHAPHHPTKERVDKNQRDALVCRP